MRDKNENKLVTAIKIIYDHVDQTLTLGELAKQVGVSLAALKRLFQDSLGQSPGHFMRRMRMELAFRTLQNREISVLEVAMSAGFDNQSAFTRCFKDCFGYTPTLAREKINIVAELERIQLEEPDIIELSDIQSQAVTETGLYYESAPRAWQNLHAKLHEDELSDDFAGVYIGIGHDNPHEGPRASDQVRFSACVTHVKRDLHAQKLQLDGGTYARFRYYGKPMNHGLAYHYIFGQWQQQANYHINNEKPAFIMVDKFPAARQEQRSMIHVPIKS